MKHSAEHAVQMQPEYEATTHYEILSDPEVRENLLERMQELTEQIHDRNINSLVFLDRSARPLAWMFHDLWKQVYPETKAPDIKFLNVGTSTFTQKGTARMFTYDAGKEPWYLEDDARHMVQQRDIQHDWLSASDIPEEWQSTIAEQTDRLQVLEKTFSTERNGKVSSHEFENKHVLIVDDIISSGRSQLVAIGILTAAFPNAEFQSTALFKSLRNTNTDRKFLPWLSLPAMSGILELPETELLSARVTPEHIERIREELKHTLEEKMEVPLHRMEDIDQTYRECIQQVESLPDSVTEIEKQRLLGDLQYFKTHMDGLKAERQPKNFPYEEFKERHEKFILFFTSVLIRLPTEDAKQIQNSFHNFEWAIPTNYYELDAACRIQELLDTGYTTAQDMLAQSRRLRKELAQLVKTSV